MTLYIITYSESDTRLHAANGDELHSGKSVPSNAKLVEWLVEYHKPNGLFETPTSRGHHTDVVTGNIEYRDLSSQAEPKMPWDN